MKSLYDYIRLLLSVGKDLFKLDKKGTLLQLSLSLLLIGNEYLELLFVEYSANQVAFLGEGDGSYGVMVGFAAIFLGLVFFRLLENAKNRQEVHYQASLSKMCQVRLVEKISLLPYPFFEEQKNYETIELAKKAEGEFRNALNGISIGLHLTAMLVLYFIQLSRIGLLFVFLMAAAFFLCVYLSVRVTKRQILYWEKKVSPLSRRTAYFRDIDSERIYDSQIKHTGSHLFFLDKYGSSQSELRTRYLHLNAYSFFTDCMAAVFFIVVYLLAIVAAAQKTAAGDLSIGYFSMLLALLGNLYLNIRKFLIFSMDQSWMIRIFQAYYQIIAVSEGASTNGAVSNRGTDLRLAGVSYRYPQSDHPALHEISFHLDAGKKIAVVGENGSGKTTLMLILCGLLQPSEGEITCPDPSQIAVLFQDFAQYPMTLRENIEAGNGGKRLSEEKLEGILQSVGLLEAAGKLPHGVDTDLGTIAASSDLSRGQWQRVAIARLLAREDARVWILDEPAAYLDVKSEIELYRLAFSLSGDRTVIFISHRMGFTSYADRILVMKDGRVAESGNHRELLEKEGEYASLYHAQLKMFQ